MTTKIPKPNKNCTVQNGGIIWLGDHIVRRWHKWHKPSKQLQKLYYFQKQVGDTGCWFSGQLTTNSNPRLKVLSSHTSELFILSRVGSCLVIFSAILWACLPHMRLIFMPAWSPVCDTLLTHHLLSRCFWWHLY